PVSFPENAYSAAEWTVDSRGASRASPVAAFLTAVGIPAGRVRSGQVQFCPHELKTVATRRLVVCSPALSRDDGYAIATAVGDALSSQSKLIGDWKAGPPGTATVAELESLGIEIHPGGALHRDNT